MFWLWTAALFMRRSTGSLLRWSAAERFWVSLTTPVSMHVCFCIAVTEYNLCVWSRHVKGGSHDLCLGWFGFKHYILLGPRANWSSHTPPKVSIRGPVGLFRGPPRDFNPGPRRRRQVSLLSGRKRPQEVECRGIYTFHISHCFIHVTWGLGDVWVAFTPWQVTFQGRSNGLVRERCLAEPNDGDGLVFGKVPFSARCLPFRRSLDVLLYRRLRCLTLHI